MSESNDDELKHIMIADIFSNHSYVREDDGKKVVSIQILSKNGFVTFISRFPEKYEIMGRGNAQTVCLKSGKFISIVIHF